jgi:hypothetical protein
MQTWKKLGRIFDPAETSLSYASVPILQSVDSQGLNIIFSSRDESGRSIVRSAKFDPSFKLLKVLEQPILFPGSPGFFDEDGSMATELISIDNKKYLYYIGWNKGLTVPFRNAIGLAIGDEKGNFKKISQGPILDRSIYDPCFVASCSVRQEKDVFRMWYLSGIEWINKDNKFSHRYNIKYAESNNGINWKREGKIAIDFAYENEYAISVPRIIFENGIYKAWFSYRGGPYGKTYRIGYAESTDGLKFDRKDNLINLSPGNNEWDSEMICYPYIFDYNGHRYMLYNGNGYGKTGFGLAILV